MTLPISASKKPITLTLLIILFAFTANHLKAQSITVSGTNWTVPIETLTEAGKDYIGTYESPSNQFNLDVTIPLLLGSVTVGATYNEAPHWDDHLKLALRHTGTGSTLCVLCTITPPGVYKPLTKATSQQILTITNVLALTKFSMIPIQLKASGISVTVPTGTNTATVIFTISSP